MNFFSSIAQNPHPGFLFGVLPLVSSSLPLPHYIFCLVCPSPSAKQLHAGSNSVLTFLLVWTQPEKLPAVDESETQDRAAGHWEKLSGIWGGWITLKDSWEEKQRDNLLSFPSPSLSSFFFYPAVSKEHNRGIFLNLFIERSLVLAFSHRDNLGDEQTWCWMSFPVSWEVLSTRSLWCSQGVQFDSGLTAAPSQSCLPPLSLFPAHSRK